MPIHGQVMVRCDAPHCDALVEAHDGRTLFDSIEDALATAEEHDWLLTHPHRDDTAVSATYCPRHWHRQFGLRMPYWGAPQRAWRR